MSGSKDASFLGISLNPTPDFSLSYDDKPIISTIEDKGEGFEVSIDGYNVDFLIEELGKTISSMENPKEYYYDVIKELMTYID